MILKQSLRSFASSLASREPVPGGGSAAGYVGGLGAALAEMAIAYSRTGVTRESDPAPNLEEGAIQMGQLREKLLALTERDGEAYGAFSQALKLPRGTGEEKAARKQQMKAALRDSLDVPFQAAILCLEGFRLLDSLIDEMNPRLITDVGVSAQCFGASFRSCWYNVRVNARALKEPEVAAEKEAQRKEMEKQVSDLEKKIFEKVDRMLAL
jgi:formiminotetrahydrofolate cyclodeaminase